MWSFGSARERFLRDHSRYGEWWGRLLGQNCCNRPKTDCRAESKPTNYVRVQPRPMRHQDRSEVSAAVDSLRALTGRDTCRSPRGSVRRTAQHAFSTSYGRRRCSSATVPAHHPRHRSTAGPLCRRNLKTAFLPPGLTLHVTSPA